MAMTKTGVLITVVGAAILLPGCVFVKGLGTGKHGVSAAGQCHPSEYWDGEKCRHKGKGKGARKHDDD